MTKKELIQKLQELQALSHDDWEMAHVDADNLLLVYINDPEITKEFKKIKRYYS